MTNTLQHRGPDGHGYYLKDNLALGHRRLSIIDLSSGDQPMKSEGDEIVLVFNGEIYNYIELKEELVKDGFVFTTQSDTEVIINSYLKWGYNCQSKFNGMWSFALWDSRNESLFISRDRIGEKPLLYCEFDNTFIFGSEIKSVLDFGVPVCPRVDLSQLYITLGFIPAPYTFYRGIHKLQAGQFIIVDSKGLRIQTYWDLPDIDDQDMRRDKAAIEHQFELLLSDSVRLRMRSDVKFGAFLSGGLDSSSIVALMGRESQLPVETFTIGFDSKGFDERHLAALSSKRFVTNHHEGMMTQDHVWAALDKVVAQYDEPFGDPSALPTGFVSQFAVQFVKMVLTGDGGDEVLSGYTTYQGEKFSAFYSTLPGIIRTALPSMIDLLSKPLRGSIRYSLNRSVKVLRSANLGFEERLFTKLAGVSQLDIKNIFLRGTDGVSFHDYYSEVMKGCRFKDPFYKLMYFQLKVTLPDQMLVKVDRASMAHSLETRIPFLDYRLVEHMYGVHKDIKMSGFQNKSVLRNTIGQKHLPKELLKAPKKGFDVPLREWFQSDTLESELTELFKRNNSVGIFNTDAIINLVKENKLAKADYGRLIWRAAILKNWANNFDRKGLQHE